MSKAVLGQGMVQWEHDRFLLVEAWIHEIPKTALPKYFWE